MKKIFLVIFILILLTGQSFASSGYKIYVGTASGNYNVRTINVGLVLLYTVLPLTPGTTYYFAAKAWLDSCIAPYEPIGAYCESSYSNEVNTVVGSSGMVALAWDASPAVPVPNVSPKLTNSLFFNF